MSNMRCTLEHLFGRAFDLLKSSERLKWNPLESSEEMQAANERPRSETQRTALRDFIWKSHLGPGGCLLLSFELTFLRQSSSTRRLNPVSQIISRPGWTIDDDRFNDMTTMTMMEIMKIEGARVQRPLPMIGSVQQLFDSRSTFSALEIPPPDTYCPL